MSRAFVKDADYLEEVPARPVSEHPNDVTEAAWRRSNMPLERPAKPTPLRKHQPIARPLPPRGETSATGPPGAQPLASYQPRPTTPKYGLARQ
jgi:hypothetical protein